MLAAIRLLISDERSRFIHSVQLFRRSQILIPGCQPLRSQLIVVLTLPALVLAIFRNKWMQY